MSKAIRDLKPWPAGVPLPAGALTFFYHPGLDDEFQIDPARFGVSTSGQIWYYVGDPAAQSISLGELDLTRNSFDTSGLNEGNLFYSGPTVEDNTVGAAFALNKVGLDFRRNQIGENCFDCDFQFSFTDNVLGENVNACYFDAGTQYVQVGDNCERVRLYNCKGTPQQLFVVPAGTMDAVYRNNQLVNKANEDGRFDLLTPTDRALPQSAIRGLIDWHYEDSDPTQPWTLKPGRSVMFTRSRQLVLNSDVQEGDVFSLYINPLSPVSRVELAYFGGIDEKPTKRYLPGTSIVLRYTYIPDYNDAGGNLIQAHYGLRTVQQTTLTATNFRGPYSGSAYYVAGDLVVYQGQLYLRLAEGGGNGAAFDPTKWVGGGGAPAPDGLLPLTTTRTADYTLALADAGCLVPVDSASAVTITVPDHASVPFPIGTTLYVAQDGAGAVTIAPASGVVVQKADGYKVPGQWQDIALHKRNLNTWVLKGGVS
jgi:hypothetical protein